MSRIFIAVLLLYSSILSAQSKFGFEFKLGSFKTMNKGQLEGGSLGFVGYVVTKEGDPVTQTYSLGLVYELNERNLLKLHLGTHQNGRILDIMAYDDVLTMYSYTDVDKPYQYFQVSPSYVYRLLNKRVIIPLEMGFNINKLTNEAGIFYVEVHEYNFDMEVSAGIDYRLFPEFIVGLHGVYTWYLTEYQNSMYETGTFKPEQYGIELSMQFLW